MQIERLVWWLLRGGTEDCSNVGDEMCAYSCGRIRTGGAVVQDQSTGEQQAAQAKYYWLTFLYGFPLKGRASW
jgi:hypothetical protein